MSRTPTPQQQACIEAASNEAIRLLKISACAGSGKTSTLEMVSEAIPVQSLYLAFNKVTADEGSKRFPKHVTCKTTHSVAYAAFGKQLAGAEKLSRQTRPDGKYLNVAGTGAEIARFYKVDAVAFGKEEITIPAGFIGLMAKNTVAVFEQGADEQVEMKHVRDLELKEKLHDNYHNVQYVKKIVLDTAKKLWKDRINLKSCVLATHDTYLKQFQLSKPVLAGYDVLYVDEFQDTTPCVLDIVLNQREHMKIIMVGDARQAIYGWRGAVNAMEMIRCEQRALSKSFRYGQEVADVATIVLEGDMKITGFEKLTSVVGGENIVDRTQPHCRLYRTNVALLLDAIEDIQAGKAVAIEIDIKDFVKLLTSAVALNQNIMKDVKHDKLLAYSNWQEMEAEAKHEPELSRIVKVIKDGKATEWLEVLTHFTNSKTPLVTYTTAHKSKGREFQQVIIAGDFKSCYNDKGEWTGLSTEEQNLLYVAVTRAIKNLEYNGTVAQYIARWNRTRAALKPADKAVQQLTKEVEYA